MVTVAQWALMDGDTGSFMDGSANTIKVNVLGLSSPFRRNIGSPWHITPLWTSHSGSKWWNRAEVHPFETCEKTRAWCFKWMVLAAHWQDQKMVLPHVAPTKSQASWKNAYDFFGRIQPLRIWLWKLQKQAMEDDSVCLRIARTGFLHFFRGSTRSGHLLTHFVNIYAKSIRPWILADLWSWKFYSQLATLFRDGKNWLHQ